MSNKSSVIFISVLLFWLLLAPTSVIIPDPTINGWIKNATCLFLLWYVRQDIAVMFDRESRYFNILLLTFCTILTLSVYYNIDTISRYTGALFTSNGKIELEGVTSVKSTLYSAIGLLASSLYVQRIAATEDIRIFLKTFFWLLLLVLIPTDIDVFMKSAGADVNALTQYLVGNKFSVGYCHLYLCAFYYFLYPYLECQRNKYILFFLIAMMFITSIRTQSSTMVLASITFMFLALFLPYFFRDIISSVKSIISALIIIGIGFFLFVTWLLQYETFQYIITDILKEDITLTGRIQIFASIQQAFTLSPWIGLGYGNSMVVSHYFTGALNSQNGLIDLFIQVGFLGIITFIALLYNVSKRIEQDKELRYPLVAFIFTMIVISMVEIPFKHIFIFFLSFCFIERQAYDEYYEDDDIEDWNDGLDNDEVMRKQMPDMPESIINPVTK